jgi:methylated-DNA-protein-cysteine methyltransferase-like protein
MGAALKPEYRRIWSTIAAIPRGRVASYGQIGELAGFSRGARLVVRALRYAPDDLDLPWHRVLNAQGKIAIPVNSPSHAEQARRLADEDVPMVAGRVDMDRYRWQPDLDELMWGPLAFNTDHLAGNVDE